MLNAVYEYAQIGVCLPSTGVGIPPFVSAWPAGRLSQTVLSLQWNRLRRLLVVMRTTNKAATFTSPYSRPIVNRSHFQNTSLDLFQLKINFLQRLATSVARQMTYEKGFGSFPQRRTSRVNHNHFKIVFEMENQAKANTCMVWFRR